MKVLAGLLLGIGAVAIAGVIYIYSGSFNVAAVEPHGELEILVLKLARDRSVKARAQDITLPPTPPSQKIGEAFRMFNEMCTQCHGAPGKEPTVVGKGLNPRPPKLSEVVQDWRRAELFWIVKNGLKMTGMPAFGPTHSDEELWLLVAFLQRLPNISAAEYSEMEGKFGGSDQGQQPPPHRH